MFEAKAHYPPSLPLPFWLAKKLYNSIESYNNTIEKYQQLFIILQLYFAAKHSNNPSQKVGQIRKLSAVIEFKL